MHGRRSKCPLLLFLLLLFFTVVSYSLITPVGPDGVPYSFHTPLFLLFKTILDK